MSISTELDELINSFSESDRETARALLERNASVQSRLASRETVYRAFVDGDPAAVTAAAQQQQAITPAVAAQPISASAAPSPASITLDQITTLLNERIRGVYSAPEFTSAVESRAQAIATSALAAERASLIGQGAEIADQLYSIRASHSREFGEELDSAAFKTFFQSSGTRYGNQLQPAYDAFVGEKRIAKREADAFARGQAAAATTNVPGSTLTATGPNSSPLSAFIDHNVRTITPNATAPSADADKAAQAFSAMRSQWTQ
jgi:hypothetical protein